MKFALLIGMIASGFIVLFSLLEGAVTDLVGAVSLMVALLILYLRDGLPSRPAAIVSAVLISVFVSTQLLQRC